MKQNTQQDGWISVKERLPKDYERIMYWDSREAGYHEIGYFVSTQTPVPRYVTH